MTSIILADDHRVVREGFRFLIEREHDLSVVAEASDGLQALKVVERFKPDILIVDLLMPEMNGLQVIPRVHTKVPQTRIIVLTMRSTENYVREALKSGARAYVVKSCTCAELIHAIREVMLGRRYLSPTVSEYGIDDYVQRLSEAPACPTENLTGREIQVLQLALRGLTNAEIAKRLGVSVSTIATHRANLMKKLGVHNQTELVRHALAHGLSPLDE